jgi:hypothetical protein
MVQKTQKALTNGLGYAFAQQNSEKNSEIFSSRKWNISRKKSIFDYNSVS